MILPRHSIFVKVNLIFGVAMVILALLFGLIVRDQERQRFHRVMHRSMELSRILDESVSPILLAQKLHHAGFEKITSVRCEPLTPLHHAPPMHPHRPLPLAHVCRMDAEEVIYTTHAHQCYRDNIEDPISHLVRIVFIALGIGLVSMYILLRRNLTPLGALYDQIVRYGRGEDVDTTPHHGKDEIAQIVNAFHAAWHKQHRLKQSRELFLRNIMHELKTPITKGKLIVELEEENPNILLLKKLFSRMEHLIAQMAQIEKIHALSLQIKPTSLESMVDEACEHLLLPPENLMIEGDPSVKFYVDEALFRSALENLIDNAYRHAHILPIRIVYAPNQICILNEAPPLARPIEEVLEAFVSAHAGNGMGLGLYIAQSVCALHHAQFEYVYGEGVHHFCIRGIACSVSAP